MAFLGRQGDLEEGEDRRAALQAARDSLTEVYSLPGDSSLAVPRKLEDIFFRDVREEVRVERGRSARGGRQGRDGGNWKRNSKDEEEAKHEVKVEKQEESPSLNVEEEEEEKDEDDEEDEEPEDLDTETDLDHALAAAEEGFTLDD